MPARIILKLATLATAFAVKMRYYQASYMDALQDNCPEKVQDDELIFLSQEGNFTITNTTEPWQGGNSTIYDPESDQSGECEDEDCEETGDQPTLDHLEDENPLKDRVLIDAADLENLVDGMNKTAKRLSGMYNWAKGRIEELALQNADLPEGEEA